jgi:hypothetical protein
MAGTRVRLATVALAGVATHVLVTTKWRFALTTTTEEFSVWTRTSALVGRRASGG